MLILKRKIGEELKINSNIVLKVLSISDSQVKIGISAPNDVQIYRSELLDKVRTNIIEASQKSKEELKSLNKLKVNTVEK
ncbi:MAG: carbon storage regulator [Ignavibacteriales bacterium CG_4_9_14_3_um_filter_34_10]|nr:MAG: carbon storage regulator [Ignavibacteria bacterium CG08_land_8_20_14_0_20_37_9]PJA95440.1 MAG: carbon storage regulator [Ignavibacteriales bacterium CG_4_9_14_3_um_filter_34_10]